MNNQREFCKEIIKLINEKPSEIVFFIGAGISYNPPACLPLANEVKLEIIKVLCERSEKTFINRFYHLHEKELQEYLKKIFLESIFDIIMSRQGLNEEFVTQTVSEIFRAESQNNNHLFLARMAKIGCEIITTNFDLLIEESIKKEFSHEVDVNQFMKKIKHIHGSIDNNGSIVATLSLVGQGLPENIVNELKKALEEKTVIFIGWSDNDVDITPILFQSNIKKIYWIDYDKFKDKLVYYSNDEIFNSKDAIDRVIKKFQGIKYIGNTDDIISEMWQGLWNEKPPKELECSEKIKQKWKEPLKRLIDLEEWDRALILLEVLDRIDPKKGLPLKLIKILEKVLSSKKSSDFSGNDIFTYYELCCKESVCYRIVNNFDDAIKSAENGLERRESLAQDLKIKSLEDFCWYIELKNDIGTAHNDKAIHSYKRQSDYEKVNEEHEIAIKIFEENLQELNDKLRELQKSTDEVKLKILLSDKGQVFINLGSIFYKLSDKITEVSNSPDISNNLLIKAEENYLEGIKVYKELLNYKLSDVLRKYYETKLGELYTKIANGYFRKSEKERANSYYKKGFEILKKSGDVRRKKRLLNEYLEFIKSTGLKPENLEEISAECEILNLVFIEEPTSFYQLYMLDYKKQASHSNKHG